MTEIGFNGMWLPQEQDPEYARHCGHADLLRECLDGRTGQEGRAGPDRRDGRDRSGAFPTTP